MQIVNTKPLMPVLFVSHGAPTFALAPGRLGPALQRLGAALTAPAAVLVVSAHWMTRGVAVMRTPRPETIHDFGGFPPALYRLQYRPPGSESLADEAAQLLTQAGFVVHMEDRRGLDHGVWVPLRYLLPDEQVPVFQVSLPVDADPRRAFELGRALAPLRERGVMILGSGSLTHNLGDFGRVGPGDASYVVEFAAWVRERVLGHDVGALIDYRQRAPQALRAHPSEDHFLPLFVAVGASDEQDDVQVIDGGVEYGMLSMESYAFGLPPQAVSALRRNDGHHGAASHPA